MIPSGAILMCEQASLTSLDVVELCQPIVRSQGEEIATMQELLERY